MSLYKSCFFCYTYRKREIMAMTEEEIGELYTRLAFQYESSIDSLLARQIIDVDIATTSREKFYDALNEEKLRTSRACLKIVIIPKRWLFFRHTLPIFLGIHQVFLRQIGFVWRKNPSPLGTFPIFKQRLMARVDRSRPKYYKSGPLSNAEHYTGA